MADFDWTEPGPLTPQQERERVLCDLLREAIVGWEQGTRLIVTRGDRRHVPAARLMLEADWYERAKDAVEC